MGHTCLKKNSSTTRDEMIGSSGQNWGRGKEIRSILLWLHEKMEVVEKPSAAEESCFINKATTAMLPSTCFKFLLFAPTAISKEGVNIEEFSAKSYLHPSCNHVHRSLNSGLQYISHQELCHLISCMQKQKLAYRKKTI